MGANPGASTIFFNRISPLRRRSRRLHCARMIFPREFFRVPETPDASTIFFNNINRVQPLVPLASSISPRFSSPRRMAVSSAAGLRWMQRCVVPRSCTYSRTLIAHAAVAERQNRDATQNHLRESKSDAVSSPSDRTPHSHAVRARRDHVRRSTSLSSIGRGAGQKRIMLAQQTALVPRLNPIRTIKVF